ncbi:CotS family spore coat protein [Paenibacillus selenitireducens]|uniref:CotS family spore coat protein n=1 Tax=Paenibacillus selenitireducens TaxID=1324314 RepID=UPI000998BC62|nr:CotS family spore coat protein [Paenibacillus selenitireducens]
MDQYQVVPWDHLVDVISTGTVLEQYVPPELEALAYQVMMNYDMTVSSMVLITSKPDKGGAIWRIDTNKGPRSIKVLHRLPQRSLFSVGAQQYLVEKGARVPALIPTKNNELYIEAGGKLWIVTDWIDTLQQASKIDLEGASALCLGLGEFHHHTKGYPSPPGAAKSSRLMGWTKYYQKIIAKIGWFRDIAEAYRDTTGSGPLLQAVDEFERQAKDALERLNQSSYAKMMAMGDSYWGLAHQDYGWSNGQMGPGGIWVIDLDGVAYDLPFRDLRKLMTSTMDDMGTWDITWIRSMIAAYHQGNPLDREMFEILWIDMAFPNEFYKHTKEIVFDPVNFLNLEFEPILQRVLATESTKWQVLQELWKDMDMYPAGNYIVEPVAIAKDLPIPPVPSKLSKPKAADPAPTPAPAPAPTPAPAMTFNPPAAVERKVVEPAASAKELPTPPEFSRKPKPYAPVKDLTANAPKNVDKKVLEPAASAKELPIQPVYSKEPKPYVPVKDLTASAPKNVDKKVLEPAASAKELPTQPVYAKKPKPYAPVKDLTANAPKNVDKKVVEPVEPAKELPTKPAYSKKQKPYAPVKDLTANAPKKVKNTAPEPAASEETFSNSPEYSQQAIHHVYQEYNRSERVPHYFRRW